MIHDLTITLNEATLPFLPRGDAGSDCDPHMVWVHRVDHFSAPCQVSLALISSHLGTHVDAPLHFIPNGKTTAQIDLSRYCGQAVCVKADDFPKGLVEYDMTALLANNKDAIRPGDILILSTGYEKLVGTRAYFACPDFAENTGELLEKYGVVGIGFDTPTIGLNRSHHEVLGRDIAIFESLINLEPLIGKRFYFSAVPLKFEDGDGSPVRAYAVTED
jgi:kynurenine formamidase